MDKTFTQVYESILNNDDVEFYVGVTDVMNLTDEEKDLWSHSHQKYSCSIECNEKEFTVDYYSSSWPRDDNILYSVVMDAEAGGYETFEEFCDNYGYSSDSIKAMKTYQACKDMRQTLLDTVGEDIFNELILCEKDL